MFTTGGDSLEALVAQVVLAGVDFELLEPKELASSIRQFGSRLVRGAT